GRTPRFERSLRDGNRLIDFFDAREIHASLLFSGCGIPDHTGTPRRRYRRLAADPMMHGPDLNARGCHIHCLPIHSAVLCASLSNAATAISKCSSRVSSILLWLIPLSDCTNIITAGIPARDTSAASCRGPEGSR